MNLATKLSLFVGALLLLICVMVYFLPIYVAKRQGAVDQQAYQARIQAQLEEDWNNQNGWLAGEFAMVEGTIDSFLFLAIHNPEIFQLREAKGADVWLVLSRLLNYNDMINFLQASQKGGVIAGITFADVPHYWALEEPIDETLAWISLDSREWTDPNNWDRPLVLPPDLVQLELIGVRIPEEGNGFPFYLLFDPEEFYEAGSTKVHDYLTKEFKTKEELQTFLTKRKQAAKRVKTASPLEEEMREVKPGGEEAQAVAQRRFIIEFLSNKMRARELEMTTAMAYAASKEGKSPLAKGEATGAARIDGAKRQGGGILARDVFTTTRLFDDVNLYKTYPPFESEVPISTGYGIVSGPATRQTTVVNALRSLEFLGTDGFLTLGIGVDPIIQDLQTITGQSVILISRGEIVGYVINGTEADKRAFVNSVEKITRSFDQKTGFVTVAGIKYYYSAFKPQETWDLQIVTFKLAEQVEEPYALFQERSKALMHRISLNLLIVAAVVFSVALTILILIAKHFTRPIRTLAEATQHVAEGKYEAIVLPTVPKKSQNEIALLTHAFSQMVQGLSDKAKTRAVLDKVVSKEIADEILKGHVHLGGEVKEVTVLFADIRSFTRLSEHLPPEETISFVNGYMTEMTRVIEMHQGVIDKYVGDEVMALFGAPVPHKYSPLQAVISALLIMERLKVWNEERRKASKIVAMVGIGITFGKVVAGNMGAEDRLNYTVLGADVNLAFRLTETARPGEILIPQKMAVLPLIAEHIEVVEGKEPLTLEGFTDPVEVVRVVGLKPGHTLESISQMVASYEAGH